MNGTLFRASGIDTNEGAKNVFVWYHDKRSDKYSLLGSGHVLTIAAALPGAEVGQYSVTFSLPYGYSAENIVVTDDTNAKGVLSGVNLSPTSAFGLAPSRAAVTRDRPLGPVGSPGGPSRVAASDPSRLGNAKESET
jgi:hypothetical protein